MSDPFEEHGKIGRVIHRLLCRLGIHHWALGTIPFHHVIECEICGLQKDSYEIERRKDPK